MLLMIRCSKRNMCMCLALDGVYFKTSVDPEQDIYLLGDPENNYIQLIKHNWKKKGNWVFNSVKCIICIELQNTAT